MRARSLLREPILVALAAASLAGACVLAEPVTDLPQAAVQRPTIVRASVFPPANAVLTSFPSTFVVPVELGDPTVTLQYAAFIDFSPTNGQSLVLLDTSTFEASNLSSKTRRLEIPVPPPSQLAECHTIEVVVGLELSGTGAIEAHTPRGGAGDSVLWYYNPNGDFGGCPAIDVDAGDAAPVEAGSDGGPQ